MTEDDIKIDFLNKKIFFKANNKRKAYSARELYSFLQDTFDEPENMKYEIPIMAKSRKEFKLINGWTIDNKSRSFLKDGILETG